MNLCFKIAISIILAGYLFSCQEKSFWESKSAFYSQTPPDSIPQLFMPEAISHLAHSSPTFSPDGKEIYLVHGWRW